MHLQKPNRIEDKKYLEYIRETPCLICGKRSEPHHLTTRGSGGSDYTSIPFCRSHHADYHLLGLSAFEEKYNINVWKETHRLLEKWMLNND